MPVVKLRWGGGTVATTAALPALPESACPPLSVPNVVLATNKRRMGDSADTAQVENGTSQESESQSKKRKRSSVRDKTVDDDGEKMTEQQVPSKSVRKAKGASEAADVPEGLANTDLPTATVSKDKSRKRPKTAKAPSSSSIWDDISAPPRGKGSAKGNGKGKGPASLKDPGSGSMVDETSASPSVPKAFRTVAQNRSKSRKKNTSKPDSDGLSLNTVNELSATGDAGESEMDSKHGPRRSAETGHVAMDDAESTNVERAVSPLPVERQSNSSRKIIGVVETDHNVSVDSEVQDDAAGLQEEMAPDSAPPSKKRRSQPRPVQNRVAKKSRIVPPIEAAAEVGSPEDDVHGPQLTIQPAVQRPEKPTRRLPKEYAADADVSKSEMEPALKRVGKGSRNAGNTRERTVKAGGVPEAETVVRSEQTVKQTVKPRHGLEKKDTTGEKEAGAMGEDDEEVSFS
ncbi:hypothetical protein HK104_000232 [Borealophlyctis nickersoniae]|nr:hypothetical protein HK104_000232 [Borealophlyctis nickersoniae]